MPLVRLPAPFAARSMAPVLGHPSPMAQSRLRRNRRHRHHHNQSEPGCWASWRRLRRMRIRAAEPLPGAALDGQCHTRPLGSPAPRTLSRRGCQCWAALASKSWPICGASVCPSVAAKRGCRRHQALPPWSGVRAAGSLAEGRRRRWDKGARPIRDGPQIGAASAAQTSSTQRDAAVGGVDYHRVNRIRSQRIVPWPGSA